MPIHRAILFLFQRKREREKKSPFNDPFIDHNSFIIKSEVFLSILNDVLHLIKT